MCHFWVSNRIYWLFYYILLTKLPDFKNSTVWISLFYIYCSSRSRILKTVRYRFHFFIYTAHQTPEVQKQYGIDFTFLYILLTKRPKFKNSTVWVSLFYIYCSSSFRSSKKERYRFHFFIYTAHQAPGF